MSLALYYIITYSEVVNFVILKPKLRWKEINVKQKLFLTRSLCITISSTFWKNVSLQKCGTVWGKIKKQSYYFFRNKWVY